MSEVKGRPPAGKNGLWIPVFLSELQKHGHIGKAAQKAKVNPTVARRRRGRDKDFAQKWDEALSKVRIVQSRTLDRLEEVYDVAEMIGNENDIHSAPIAARAIESYRMSDIALEMLIDRILMQRERRMPANVLISEATQGALGHLRDALDDPDLDLDKARSAIEYAITELERFQW